MRLHGTPEQSSRHTRRARHNVCTFQSWTHDTTLKFQTCNGGAKQPPTWGLGNGDNWLGAMKHRRCSLPWWPNCTCQHIRKTNKQTTVWQDKPNMLSKNQSPNHMHTQRRSSQMVNISWRSISLVELSAVQTPCGSLIFDSKKKKKRDRCMLSREAVASEPSVGTFKSRKEKHAQCKLLCQKNVEGSKKTWQQPLFERHLRITCTRRYVKTY